MGCGASKKNSVKETSGSNHRTVAKNISTAHDICGLVMLEIVEGKNLPSMDPGGGADPFVVVSFGRHIFRTTTCHRNKNPKWEQLVFFFVQHTELGFDISLEVYDEDTMSANDHISSASIKLSAATVRRTADSEPENMSLPLKSKTGESCGELVIKCRQFNKSDIEKLFWKYVFDMFDRNGDGTLQKEELRTVLDTMCCTMEDSTLDKLFITADKDSNGVVDSNEFYTFITQQTNNIVPETLLASEIMSALRSTEQDMSNDDGPRLDNMEAIWKLALLLFQVSPNRFAGSELDSNSNPVQKLILTETYAMTADGAAGIRDSSKKEDDEGKNMGTDVFFQDRRSGRIEKEAIPAYIRIGMRLMYGTHPESAAGLLRKFTKSQGAKYDDPKSVKDIPDFVKFHDINLDECEKKLEEYSTFNQFFYRKLKAGTRPLAEPPADTKILHCPADARTLVFNNVSSLTELWVKGRKFTIANLLASEELASSIQDPHVTISRLAPQDYHRFHCVCPGTVKSMTVIEGEFYTVNPVAVRSTVDVFTENSRVVVEVDTGDYCGIMIYVAIGATMVGSINFTKKVGDVVAAGDDFGYFAFGGSTVVTLFKKGTITFADDLLQNSEKPTETLTRVGEILATIVKQ
eukprot:TRINITY_DN8146_c1_g1_i3.p1 TRINITY_DN8146_c1_g1~~TRINITY_DN8146_c1_g1_i3.p1  ORF type:complete len:633 (+),score=118.39 TRINITY_DN8146_c1_g1_i3:38-1936(+)